MSGLSLLRRKSFGRCYQPRDGLRVIFISAEQAMCWKAGRLSFQRQVSGTSSCLVGASSEHSESEQRSHFPNVRDAHQHPLTALSAEEAEAASEKDAKAPSRSRPVRSRVVDEEGQAFAIGSRKRSKAKVWLREGNGQIVVNGRSWVDYFQRLDHRDKILQPLGLLGLHGKMDVTCQIRGGGCTGQAEALRHGLARALQNWDPLVRPSLKGHGFLTRDSREVESKKYGRKKARKAFQWVKR